MKFLTGITLATWLKIGAGIALALFVWSWWSRGEAIDDLRQTVANERAAHDVTRASLASVQGELTQQNAAIEAQRADTAQAKRDLAAAIEASAGVQGAIKKLTASARSVPAGSVCVPSETVRSVWE